METIAYRSLPIDQSDVRYQHGPDSEHRPGTPAGETIELSLPTSSVYPGTTRRVWVHVPAGHDPAKPAALVVFQDGWWYLDPNGEVRSGIVLDNLINAGDLPPTIGVFVDPGVFTDGEDPDGRKNRNAEYDAFDDRYATFILDEVLPVVQQRWALSEDPAHRAICGGSSGGNCAVTAAWLRPDQFGRVVAFLSSFAQIPGGNPYPVLIAATPPKPLRIFLQAGHRDLNWDQPEWNWLANNLRVAAAFAEAGYDFRLVLGDGGHSPNHGGVLLPDALRWVFRAPQSAPSGQLSVRAAQEGQQVAVARGSGERDSAQVVLLCGLAGSGKTTYAQGLEASGYVRLSIDEEVWSRFGRFGVDYEPARYAELSAVAEAALRHRLVALVRQGRDVVIDFSFWQRAARDRYKQLIEDAGGSWRLVYLRADQVLLRRRLKGRSRRFDANAAFPITDDIFASYLAGFEEPHDEGEEIVDGSSSC